jgi:hypothetical protein
MIGFFIGSSTELRNPDGYLDAAIEGWRRESHSGVLLTLYSYRFPSV